MKFKAAAFAAVLAVALGIGLFPSLRASGQAAPAAAAPAAGSKIGATKAAAVLVPTKGNSQIAGTIWFETTDKGVRVHGTVTGFAPNTEHGFHIHEFGDQTSEDGMAAGTHYNPGGHQHGGPATAVRHAGDLGNLKADATGKATIDIVLADISVSDGKNPIIGRGAVVHALPDNLLPNANPGARMAVGVIGVVKP